MAGTLGLCFAHKHFHERADDCDRWTISAAEMTAEHPGEFGPAPYNFGSDLLPGMSKLIEEMGELLQVFGKIMGTGGDLGAHWDGSVLSDRLTKELADVYAALMWFFDNNTPEIDEDLLLRRVVKKYERFTRWHAGNGTEEERRGGREADPDVAG